MKKPPLCIFSIRILNKETFTFLSLIIFSILDDTDLLTAIPSGNKDGTLLPLGRCHFSSWLSSNETLVKYSEHIWIALEKTGLAIAFIQASLISFLSRSGILWYETFWFNLDWFKQLFTYQVAIFVSSKVPLLLSYNLNTVSLNDKM